ncbi:hypothetical protein IKQ19_14920 [Candidatus Saccharibacteria bacterium]|nr:hypothetical protein [Candidatus Saccharibacteria bacterium]
MGQRSCDEILKIFVEDIFPFCQNFQIQVFQSKNQEFIQCLNGISGYNYKTVDESYVEFVKAVSLSLFKNGSFIKGTSEVYPFRVEFPKKLSKKNVLFWLERQNEFLDYSEYSLMYNKYNIAYNDLKEIIRNNNISINRRLRNFGDILSTESRDYKTQFYLVYREIKLQKAKAIMREHIYYALSEYIRKNNLDLYFILKNLYYPTDYERVLREFTERKIGMAETLKKVM